ncbi:hypothetical protein K2X85_03625 [bacterium]|nr:hypothetical protein [bacterium]
MPRWILIVALSLAQVVGWSGRAHYLCFAPDGTLHGIDGGPHACYFNHQSLEDADLRSSDCSHGDDGHVLISVDLLSAQSRMVSADAPLWYPPQTVVAPADFAWIFSFSAEFPSPVELPPRFSLLQRAVCVFQC